MDHLVLRVYKDPTFVVAQRLNDAGFVCYCPALFEKRVNRHHKLGGTFLHKVPMFPGYVFLEKPDPPRRVGANGVKAAPLTVDGRYLLLRDVHIAAIRQHEAFLAEPIPDPVVPRPPTAGDVVTLLRGVLARSKAVVINVRNSRQVLIRLLNSDSNQVFVNLSDLR